MSNILVFKVAFATDDLTQPDNRYFYSMQEAGAFIDQVMWKEMVDKINFLQAVGSDEAQSLRERTTASISIITMADVPDLA